MRMSAITNCIEQQIRQRNVLDHTAGMDDTDLDGVPLSMQFCAKGEIDGSS